MAEIQFSKEERELIVRKIQDYFQKELEQEIGQFDAEFLLDFFTNEVGAYFYNRGLYDARGILVNRLADITDAYYELEKPTEFSK